MQANAHEDYQKFLFLKALYEPGELSSKYKPSVRRRRSIHLGFFGKPLPSSTASSEIGLELSRDSTNPFENSISSENLVPSLQVSTGKAKPGSRCGRSCIEICIIAEAGF